MVPRAESTGPRSAPTRGFSVQITPSLRANKLKKCNCFIFAVLSSTRHPNLEPDPNFGYRKNYLPNFFSNVTLRALCRSGIFGMPEPCLKNWQPEYLELLLGIWAREWRRLGAVWSWDADP
jgi:hypothetical protein